MKIINVVSPRQTSASTTITEQDRLAGPSENDSTWFQITPENIIENQKELQDEIENQIQKYLDSEKNHENKKELYSYLKNELELPHDFCITKITEIDGKISEKQEKEIALTLKETDLIILEQEYSELKQSLDQLEDWIVRAQNHIQKHSSSSNAKIDEIKRLVNQESISEKAMIEKLNELKIKIEKVKNEIEEIKNNNSSIKINSEFSNQVTKKKIQLEKKSEYKHIDKLQETIKELCQIEKLNEVTKLLNDFFQPKKEERKAFLFFIQNFIPNEEMRLKAFLRQEIGEKKSNEIINKIKYLFYKIKEPQTTEFLHFSLPTIIKFEIKKQEKIKEILNSGLEKLEEKFKSHLLCEKNNDLKMCLEELTVFFEIITKNQTAVEKKSIIEFTTLQEKLNRMKTSSFFQDVYSLYIFGNNNRKPIDDILLTKCSHWTETIHGEQKKKLKKEIKEVLISFDSHENFIPKEHFVSLFQDYIISLHQKKVIPRSLDEDSINDLVVVLREELSSLEINDTSDDANYDFCDDEDDHWQTYEFDADSPVFILSKLPDNEIQDHAPPMPMAGRNDHKRQVKKARQKLKSRIKILSQQIEAAATESDKAVLNKKLSHLKKTREAKIEDLHVQIKKYEVIFRFCYNKVKEKDDRIKLHSVIEYIYKTISEIQNEAFQTAIDSIKKEENQNFEALLKLMSKQKRENFYQYILYTLKTAVEIPSKMLKIVIEYAKKDGANDSTIFSFIRLSKKFIPIYDTENTLKSISVDFFKTILSKREPFKILRKNINENEIDLDRFDDFLDLLLKSFPFQSQNESGINCIFYVNEFLNKHHGHIDLTKSEKFKEINKKLIDSILSKNNLDKDETTYLQLILEKYPAFLAKTSYESRFSKYADCIPYLEFELKLLDLITNQEHNKGQIQFISNRLNQFRESYLTSYHGKKDKITEKVKCIVAKLKEIRDKESTEQEDANAITRVIDELILDAIPDGIPQNDEALLIALKMKLDDENTDSLKKIISAILDQNAAELKEQALAFLEASKKSDLEKQESSGLPKDNNKYAFNRRLKNSEELLKLF